MARVLYYLFAMLGAVGNHGAEMDSRYGSTPRSHPAFYGMTVVGEGLAEGSATVPFTFTPTDSSGTLQCVRVWHGGTILGLEINGMTSFGGGGSGTVVDHCEVAFNLDNGFELFGGNVNIKNLSVLFAGDDAFDTDDGYVGKGQFLFAMLGAVGNHGCEMDSRYGSLPRSHPAFYGMTIVGAGALSTRAGNAMMRLREGTGGKFGNLILANVATHPGIRIDTCSNASSAAPSIVSVLPANALESLDTYLFFSSNNIIESPTAGFQILSPCIGTAPNFTNTDPLIFGGTFTETSTSPIVPRPACGSAAYSIVDPVPNGDLFFSSTTYKGAFGSVNWLNRWSFFNLPNHPGFVSSTFTCPSAAGNSVTQDVTPRSHPAFYSFTLIGGGSGTGARTGELMHINDGTGGKFGNGILAYPNLNGLLFEDCGSTLSYTQTLPAASVSISNPGYFYFSANNIIDTATAASQFALLAGGSGVVACTPADTWTAVSGAPGFAAVATTDLAEGSATFNPLPSATGAACTGTKDAPPNGDAFFSTVSCKGAFGSTTDNWLAGYSWLACSGKMAGRTCTGIPASPFATLQSTVTLVPSTIASNTVLAASTSYIHASQVFVQSGVTLTIPAGTTIFALPMPTGVAAPALVVLKGGMLMATGSATMPITFTSVLAESALVSSATASTDSNENAITLGERGKWGGLILLGNAPTNMPTTTPIEGITGYTYGGNIPTESSGSLQYVRVWHGGAIVGANNEINGITFGGVGSGTVVDHCEVAYNADDGFEFFGGTVNVKYLSVLFAGNDAFDTDDGYIGKNHLLFAMLGNVGNHGAEMDSRYGSTPRSHPASYGMTVVGAGLAKGSATLPITFTHTDSSSTLLYVRAWQGGAVVGSDNEINGMTSFDGGGSSIVVDHCEVTYNADDAFEFFGGTVNVKYLSALFFGDDGFDTDDGYVGRGQFLFAMTGAVGNYGCEMDSRWEKLRSHPAFYGMTIVGAGALSSSPLNNPMMRMREGLSVIEGLNEGLCGDRTMEIDSSVLVANLDVTPSLTLPAETLPAAAVSISNPGFSSACISATLANLASDSAEIFRILIFDAGGMLIASLLSLLEGAGAHADRTQSEC
mgnify:FL=1